MKKSEFVEAVATEAGLTKKDAEKFIEAYSKVVTDTIKSGDSILIASLGKFEAVDKPERQGKNPSTGEPITIAACKAAKFKASKALKDALNS